VGGAGGIAAKFINYEKKIIYKKNCSSKLPPL
jgi:hypothetical protein